MIGRVDLFNDEERQKIGQFLQKATGQQMVVCRVCSGRLAPVGFVHLPVFARPDDTSHRYEGIALLTVCIQCGHLVPFTERPDHRFPEL